jgi:hypothetical protein
MAGSEWVSTEVVTRSGSPISHSFGPGHFTGAGDPYVAPPPARPFREEVGADPGDDGSASNSQASFEHCSQLIAQLPASAEDHRRISPLLIGQHSIQG